MCLVVVSLKIREPSQEIQRRTPNHCHHEEHSVTPQKIEVIRVMIQSPELQESIPEEVQGHLEHRVETLEVQIFTRRTKESRPQI